MVLPINAVLMIDAMALSCSWRSVICDDASLLAEHARNDRAWYDAVPCLRHHYYHSCAWWA